jgi:hypothetical protein
LAHILCKSSRARERIESEIADDLPHPRSYKTTTEFVNLKERLVEENRAEALKDTVQT